MTIQVMFSGPQGKDVPGKVGNLQTIDPVYEGNNVLVGAVIHVIRPIDDLGILCIPLKKFEVTYPLNTKFDEETERWSNYIPAELFKPSLDDVLFRFNNNVNMLLLIQGDFLGVESHNMEKQRLHDEVVLSKVQNQYLHEAVKKLRGVIMDLSEDIWKAEVEQPMGHAQKLMKEQAMIANINAPRGLGGYGRKGRHPQEVFDPEERGYATPEEQDGNFVEIPKKGKIESLKDKFLRR